MTQVHPRVTVRLELGAQGSQGRGGHCLDQVAPCRCASTGGNGPGPERTAYCLEPVPVVVNGVVVGTVLGVTVRLMSAGGAGSRNAGGDRLTVVRSQRDIFVPECRRPEAVQ